MSRQALARVTNGGLRFGANWSKSGQTCVVCEREVEWGGRLILEVRVDADSPSEQLAICCKECGHRYWVDP